MFRMARLRALLLLSATLLVALPALSQGCALCYTQAAGSTANFVRALRYGILTLVLPAMCITSAIIWAAHRKSRYYGSAAIPETYEFGAATGQHPVED